MHLRCNGTFNKYFIVNLLLSVLAKICQNRIFGKDMDKSIVYRFTQRV